MAQYFNNSEFQCKCGQCAGLPKQGIDKRLLEVLDKIRERIGQPIYVNSGYRCPDWNEAVGGVRNSFHVQGVACDITYDGIDVEYLAQIAEECGADGIGKYPSQFFVHVDTRGYTARWEE